MQHCSEQRSKCFWLAKTKIIQCQIFPYVLFPFLRVERAGTEGRGHTGITRRGTGDAHRHCLAGAGASLNHTLNSQLKHMYSQIKHSHSQAWECHNECHNEL